MLNPLKSYFNLGVQAAHITPIWKARARILTPTCPHSHTPSHIPTHLVAGLAAGLIPNHVRDIDGRGRHESGRVGRPGRPDLQKQNNVYVNGCVVTKACISV